MKTQFHIRGLNVTAGLRRWLEQSLERLESIISITDAAAVVEYRRDDAPAFRAFASLAVPGPDIHAEARDHTLEAAWLKVTAALRKQIEQRKARRDARVKRNGHLRDQATRRTRSAAGSGARVSSR
jgi:putative sigma-54 modulation protein